jgi:hypothetical protein
MIVLQHLRQFHADMLGSKRDHGSGAAKGRGGGRALERICVDDAGGGELLDMRVAVDAARQNQFAARVDLAPRGRQSSADGCDGLAGNRDIGLEHVTRGRDFTAANEEVVGGLGHGKLLLSCCQCKHGSCRPTPLRSRSRQRIMPRGMAW